MEERMLDYDMLKRENKILKEENKLLINEIIKRTQKMEQTELLQLLEFQRQRIDNIEREYDTLLSRGDGGGAKPLDNLNTQSQTSSLQSSDLVELQQQLIQSERRCQTLQEQVDNVTQTYARQLAQLKARMTEQGAQLLITAESNIPQLTTPGMHNKTGALKKKTATSGPRLDPLEGASTLRSSISSNQSYNMNTMTQNQSYSSMNNNGLQQQMNPYQNYPASQQYSSSSQLNQQSIISRQIPMQQQLLQNNSQNYTSAQSSYLNQFKMQ
eukprot:403342813